MTFSKQITANFIQNAQKAYQTKANDLLLTALIQTLGEYTSYQLCVSLEGHGREMLNSNLDLTKTVGWFTSLHPVYLTISNPSDLDNCIKEVKEQLRQIPDGGITYGIAKHNKCIPNITSNVLFNYLGQWDTTDIPGNKFKLGNDHLGQCCAIDNKTAYDITINGQIKNGVLSFVFASTYPKYIIIKLSDSYKHKLEMLIEHCSQEGMRNYTPSDFMITDVSQQELEYLLEE